MAFLRAPALLIHQLRHAIALNCWMPPPLMGEVASKWIFNGAASILTEVQRSKAATRQAIAKKILSKFQFHADPHGFHVWLNLPSQWEADSFCRETANHGVILSSGATFAPNNRLSIEAVRISLSHEIDDGRVAEGLRVIAALLEGDDSRNAMVI